MQNDLMCMEMPPKCMQVIQSEWGNAPILTYSKKMLILLILF